MASSLQQPQELAFKGNGSVYLTWEDLCVTVFSRAQKDGTKSILTGLTGYACPGQVLAIMGPSGCGKSTLLDALSGRLSSRTRQKGEILINGGKKKLAYGKSAYVTQEDTLTWTLTVKEAVYFSAQLQLPSTMSESEKRENAERAIREMGLHDSTDTSIGECGQKGLSSGQRRRLSICIELLKRPRLLFLDEPTSGLDSAASYFVMKRIVQVAREYEMTVLSSIHQPVSEVFRLLDGLCLLSSGRMVYFGPTSLANEFFATNGLACPALQNPADHYLRIINADFDEDIECGGAGNRLGTEEVIDLLVRSYSSFSTCKQMKAFISEIHKHDGGPTEKDGQATLFTQCLILTKRSFINMYRDLGYYWLRFAIYIALCTGLGSVFYNIRNSYNFIHERGSLLMFVASLLTIMAIGGFPSFVHDLKRDRLNGHYGPSAFVVSNTISSTPFLLLISVIPGAITYFLAGLQKQGKLEFVYFTLVLFACMMLVESLMMIVACFMPNFLMGLVVGAGVQGLMMLSGGFFQLPKELPKILWKYPMYYVAFHRYAYQGLYKNEIEGRVYFDDHEVGGPSSAVDGETILRDVWEVEMGYSKWVDLGVLFGMVLVYRFVFFVAIKIREKSAG
ncbi:ABC transporter G family member 11 [Striga hermonthica]|uniref:ABC transporter G family member 11 n=1 Tax=Striga hermonthica TaxID=68872 RepID=A0A9N7ND39_STRHE|nr:ABC transporter G family member 11 [Striga hermonthica]